MSEAMSVRRLQLRYCRAVDVHTRRRTWWFQPLLDFAYPPPILGLTPEQVPRRRFKWLRQALRGALNWGRF